MDSCWDGIIVVVYFIKKDLCIDDIAGIQNDDRFSIILLWYFDILLYSMIWIILSYNIMHVR